MNVALFLQASARSFGDRPAIMIGNDVRLSYAALGRAAAGLAGAMRGKFALKPGERVLLAMSNNPDYLTVLFACWQAGLVAVPVNAKLHPREIGFIGRDSTARAIFVTPDLAESVAIELPDLPLILPGSAAYATLIAADALPMQRVTPSDPAWIFYTSGTTGRPKGALLSHRNLWAMAMIYLVDVDRVDTGDSLLHLTATSHASGLFGLSFVARAATNILPESGGYDPAEMAAIVKAQQSLTFFAPSALLNRMEADGTLRTAPLDHIRTILTGAGPIFLEDMKRWLAAFGARLWNGYGQGETPCTITALPQALLWEAYRNGDEARMASVGIARTGTQVQIACADGSRAAPGEVGEVLVRGETVMAGYLNQPEASAAALKDGWLHTGDLAKMDERGFVTLLDRKKDLIITGGMNVYAREVEEALMTHPTVAEAAVIGLKDPQWGEAVIALVIPRNGAVIEPAMLDSHCLERLARFKRPKRYIVVDALPKNTAGKVLKAELRKAWAAPEDGIAANRHIKCPS